MTVSFIQTLKANAENNQVFQQVGNFSGRIWTYIQQFPNHAQDLRVAYSSLIIVNYVAFQVAKIVTKCFQCLIRSEERSEGFQKGVDYLSLFIGYGTTIGIVHLFVTKATLPLSPYMTVGISVSMIAICSLLENRQY